MQVIVETRTPQAAQWRLWSEQRVRFATRRLQALVPMAKVQLSDVNGPRGGADKRCQIELQTDKHGLLVVAATATDWRAALDQALKRAVRSLMRTWQKANSLPRHRVRPGALRSHAV